MVLFSYMVFVAQPTVIAVSSFRYKSGGSMSAYKTHERDPLFFAEGLKLVWRNGEDTVGVIVNLVGTTRIIRN